MKPATERTTGFLVRSQNPRKTHPGVCERLSNENTVLKRFQISVLKESNMIGPEIYDPGRKDGLT